MSTQPTNPAKQRPTSRPRLAPLWVAILLGALGLEVDALASGRPGGTLSETVWWLYGTPGSLRWHIAGALGSGLLLWATFHFLDTRLDWRWLLCSLAACLAGSLLAWWLL